MASREAVAQTAMLIMACWVKSPVLSPEVLAVWELVLEDVEDGELLAAAVAECGSDRDFPPTPGQLRQRALRTARPGLPWGRLWVAGGVRSGEATRVGLDAIAGIREALTSQPESG